MGYQEDGTAERTPPTAQTFYTLAIQNQTPMRSSGPFADLGLTHEAAVAAAKEEAGPPPYWDPIYTEPISDDHGIIQPRTYRGAGYYYMNGRWNFRGFRDPDVAPRPSARAQQSKKSSSRTVAEHQQALESRFNNLKTSLKGQVITPIRSLYEASSLDL